MGRIGYEPADNLRKTFLDIVKKWPWGIVIIVADVVFLTVFSFVYTLYFSKIVSHASAIMQQTPSMTSALQSQDIYSATPIAQDIARELLQIKKLAFFLAISIFVVWVAFQAFNWWNAFRISGRKAEYLQYLKGFAAVSAIWIALVSLIIYISVQLFFSNALAFQNAPNESILSIGMIAAFAVIGYFALVSYSLKGTVREVLKKTVLFSFLKLKVLVSYIIVLILALIVNLITYFLLSLSIIVGIVTGTILLLLLFVYARVYMINVVQELDKEKKKVKKKRKN